MLTIDNKHTTLLGEDALIADLSKLIQKEYSFLVNVYGEQGTGKTTLLNYFASESQIDTQFIDLEDLELLLETEHLEEKFFLLDDIDAKISKSQFRDLLSNIFLKHSNVKLLFTSQNKFFADTLPGINKFNFEIGNRIFSYEEFVDYLHSATIIPIDSQSQVPEKIKKNIYLFSTYCRDFRILFDVIDSVTSIISEKKVISAQEFLHVLTDSELFAKFKKDLIIDTQNIENNDYLFTIRTKDKIEKLRDIFLKYYPEESVMVEVIKNQFESSYMEDTFKLEIPYEDKVLNICLTYDPIELLVKLLGPRDIIMELKEINVGEATFTNSIQDKAKLILKNLGMNILDEPKGIQYFSDRFEHNLRLLTTSLEHDNNKEYMIGLGISCYQDFEHVFYEMLNFYSQYFCGSLSEFLDYYNQDNPGNQIFNKRITFGQYIGLFRYVNKFANHPNYQIKLMNLDKREAIPNKLIEKMERLSSYRSFFSHYQKMSYEIPFKTYQKRVTEILTLGIELFERLATRGVFPEIIKIKEVKFDEFGRKLFIASDWDKNEIRFSLSNQITTVDIYSHYYILRHNQSIAVNPIIIPRYLEDNREWFDGEGYDKSSQTQLKQGATLISNIQPKKHSKVLDIGCGNGMTTIELFKKEPSITIDAFDLSSSMIKKAIENRNNQNISEHDIHFFEMDAIKLNEVNKYDLVFSNATLHWVVQYKEMYTNIYESLKRGGRLAVHQGGANCYQGLHAIVKQAINELDLHMYFTGWTYPIYYPTKQEYYNMLRSVGFKDVVVESVETDGTEYPNLVDNFANAGMLPYLNQLPEDLNDKLKKAYFKLSKSMHVDQYTHRLYAYAKKEG